MPQFLAITPPNPGPLRNAILVGANDVDDLSLHWATEEREFDREKIKNTLLELVAEGIRRTLTVNNADGHSLCLSLLLSSRWLYWFVQTLPPWIPHTRDGMAIHIIRSFCMIIHDSLY